MKIKCWGYTEHRKRWQITEFPPTWAVAHSVIFTWLDENFKWQGKVVNDGELPPEFEFIFWRDDFAVIIDGPFKYRTFSGSGAIQRARSEALAHPNNG